MFLRRGRLFVYIAIPVFLGIIIAQFVRPYTPMYRATFDIGVTKEQPVEGMFSGAVAETPTIQIGSVTQRVLASFMSVNLARKVVDSLNLYVHVKNGNSALGVEAKFNEAIKQQLGPFKINVSGDRFTLYKNGDIITVGALDTLVDIGPVSLKITRLHEAVEGKNYELIVYPIDRIALALRNSLSIKVLEADKIEQEGSGAPISFTGEGLSKKLVTAKSIFPGMNLIGVLRVDVHWGNPDEASRIAEVLSNEVMEEDKREKSQQFTQSKTFIDSQLTLYQGKLTELEERVKSFKETKKIADLGASTQALIDQTSDLESRRNQLQIEQKILIDLNAYLSRTTDAGSMPNFAATMLSDPALQNFYGQLLQTEAELKGRLKEYSSNHPKVIEIQAKLDGLKEQMKEEVTKRMSTIGTEISSFDSQIGSLQRKLETVPVDEISLARLERDRETAEKLYTFFAERLEETRVQEAGVTSDLKIINPPIVSSTPVNSRRPLLTLFLSFVIAILGGGFAVFIAEYIDNTIKDPEAVKEKTGLPIFAAIPAIDTTSGGQTPVGHGSLDASGVITGRPAKSRTRFWNRLVKSHVPAASSKPEGPTIINQDVSSPEFEAFRKLAMNLDFAHPEKKYHAIYITSAGPEEGKTFIALNLSIVLATMGKRVMLIDTDFRKKSGHLTGVTRLKKERGLFDVLRGDIEPQDVKLPLSTYGYAKDPQAIQRIDVLPTGEVPPNPFVFLESDRMRDMVSTLRYRYDYVIIDGVPILLFADAAYLADFTDGVLLTARYGRTDLKELEQAKDTLTTAKSNIIGVVMNGLPRTRGGYYYKYYHRYYSKYYKKET